MNLAGSDALDEGQGRAEQEKFNPKLYPPRGDFGWISVRLAKKLRGGKRQQGVEDTARIGIGLTDAYKEIRALNAIMHNKYSRLPEKLRAWRSATHIERAPERPKKNGASSSTSPAKP